MGRITAQLMFTSASLVFLALADQATSLTPTPSACWPSRSA